MGGAFRLGSWLVQPSLNIISQNGTTIQLEPKVMSVLLCLADHPGEPVSKGQLLQTVWPDTFVGEGVLHRSISELRRVFEDEAKEPRFIQTIAKRGYRLVAPVVWLNGAPAQTERQALDSFGESDRISRRRWALKLGITGSAILLISVVIAANVRGIRNRFWTRTTPPIHSLAVLPLRNISGDTSQDYFAAGMTDELITHLSQNSNLRVISYTSSSVYKDTNKPLGQIAHELGVDAIVEGSVQRIGNRLRVNAQLVYAPEETHLWAQSYDRDVLDALAVQSEVAGTIADRVSIELTPIQHEHLGAPRPVNLDSLDAYLQGVYHLNRIGRGFGAEESRKAVESFQSAIARDPGFAPAYVKLVESYENESFPYPMESLPSQRSAVERALSLDPYAARAHLALANIRFLRDWDWPGAEAEFKQALALNSNDPFAHESFAYYLEAMGDLAAGMRERQNAQGLDPASDYLSTGFYFSRKYDDAIELLKKRVAVLPNDGGLHLQLSSLYEHKGMKSESVEELLQAATLFGFEESARRIGHAFATSGYRAALYVEAKEKEVVFRQGKLDRPDMVAATYASLGDKDKAFYWLEIAYREHTAELTQLNINPDWDPLRNDLRFDGLVRRVGLPPMGENHPLDSSSVQSK